MKTIYILSLEDINTRILGENYAIHTPDGKTEFVLDDAAADELIQDLIALRMYRHDVEAAANHYSELIARARETLEWRIEEEQKHGSSSSQSS